MSRSRSVEPTTAAVLIYHISRGQPIRTVRFLTGLESRYCYEEKRADDRYNRQIRAFQTFRGTLEEAKRQARRRALALSDLFNINIHYSQLKTQKSNEWQTEFRYLTTTSSLGFIKGTIEPGETPLLTIQREIREEVGIIVHPNRLSFTPSKIDGVALFLLPITSTEVEWIQQRVIQRDASHTGELFEVAFRSVEELIRADYFQRRVLPIGLPISPEEARKRKLVDRYNNQFSFGLNRISKGIISYLTVEKGVVLFPEANLSSLFLSSPLPDSDETNPPDTEYQARLVGVPTYQSGFTLVDSTEEESVLTKLFPPRESDAKQYPLVGTEMPLVEKEEWDASTVEHVLQINQMDTDSALYRVKDIQTIDKWEAFHHQRIADTRVGKRIVKVNPSNPTAMIDEMLQWLYDSKEKVIQEQVISHQEEIERFSQIPFSSVMASVYSVLQLIDQDIFTKSDPRQTSSLAIIQTYSFVAVPEENRGRIDAIIKRTALRYVEQLIRPSTQSVADYAASVSNENVNDLVFSNILFGTYSVSILKEVVLSITEMERSFQGSKKRWMKRSKKMRLRKRGSSVLRK